ncbi:hypothetical protein NPX13_g5228 [Xylaria arbuscula]|uniref:Heterokaryon incompatibility domain-containing protein n=1 Tax=Xylaria arbuscula TaxID=114810 RepID=A0A9W8NET1_9PEZI|nr:hypothetical protein NPX13_g5228 [Xylaria arbuscula]
MSSTPRYLLHRYNGNQFSLIETSGRSYHYDIISYCWGKQVDEYDYNHIKQKGQSDGLDSEKDRIEGLDWVITIRREKVNAFKELMRFKDVEYLWTDSLCINKHDKQQESEEMAKMFQYYKQARNCYIMMNMPGRFDPQQISDELKLLDHIMSNIGGASMVIDSMRLSSNLEERLRNWARKPWTCDVLSELAAKSAGMDVGVMNLYNTCISQVKSIFENEYFTRVWTFQEMILGKNLQIVGFTDGQASNIGSLFQWMELARDCQDKAIKIRNWIDGPRVVNTASIQLVVGLIEDDIAHLSILKTMVMSIDAARIDIINGGPHWWVENQKGISNIFSAISLTPRECSVMHDLFRGLLGIFSGLFTPEEILTEISGNDIDKISFAFFRRLSTQTGVAWTKLSISSRQRGEWDWIPVVEQMRDPMEQCDNAIPGAGSDTEKEIAHIGVIEVDKKPKPNHLKTDIFTGVVRLGLLRDFGVANSQGLTGLLGKPRKIMSIYLKEENPYFHFIFKGCNCGQTRGFFKRKKIPLYNQPIDVTGDETGRKLVECATILGCIMDPAGDVLEYKRRLLNRLAPEWHTTDISAKPFRWPDRCVSGTEWANVRSPFNLATHSMSMNYRLGAITSCGSRLAKGSTANISCVVRVNCGCTITAPFSLIFEALTSVVGSSLGEASAKVDEADRIILSDGLGLVQIGDLGKTYNLVAFGGDMGFHYTWANACRKSKRPLAPAVPTLPPRGRALIKSDFKHSMLHMLRNYGYVTTRGREFANLP